MNASNALVGSGDSVSAHQTVQVPSDFCICPVEVKTSACAPQAAGANAANVSPMRDRVALFIVNPFVKTMVLRTSDPKIRLTHSLGYQNPTLNRPVGKLSEPFLRLRGSVSQGS